jgi:hypothetical protein
MRQSTNTQCYNLPYECVLFLLLSTSAGLSVECPDRGDHNGEGGCGCEARLLDGAVSTRSLSMRHCLLSNLVSTMSGVLTQDDDVNALYSLFKSLMGNGVLETKQADSELVMVAGPSLLSYCHCSRRFDRGLALLLVNPANANTTVTMQFTASGGAQWHAVVYQLAPGPNSTDIKLNGKLLQVTKAADGWSMPTLDGQNVSQATGAAQTVMVQKQSYMFVEYPNAAVSACAHDKQARVGDHRS